MSVVAALMLPDLRFDVAVMRVRLGLMRVRGVPNHSSFESRWPVAPRPDAS